jgi:hypothetical protein
MGLLLALMMEAVSISETSSVSTILHGAVSQKTAIFILFDECGPHALDTLDITCEKKVFFLHPQSRCYNDDV